MNWPEIAASLRKVWNVTSEKVGHVAGTWKDKAGNERLGFTASYERGGTKLVLVVEVEDFEALDAAIAARVKQGIENVFLIGRMVAMRQTLDTARLTRVTLEAAAAALAERAVDLKRGRLTA